MAVPAASVGMGTRQRQETQSAVRYCSGSLGQWEWMKRGDRRDTVPGASAGFGLETLKVTEILSTGESENGGAAEVGGLRERDQVCF